MESKKEPEPAEEMEERYVLPLEPTALKTQTTTRSFEESWMTTTTWVPTPPPKAEALKEEKKKEEGC